MYVRLLLVLAIVRLYFALSPSYIHPDEHFQGPEVIAGDIFGWQTLRTWEFTSEMPIRSVFPLSLIFGLPMQILHWIVPKRDPNPKLIYYTLRVLFFLLSFVFEDWAVQELAPSRRRKTAMLLCASSYVTWTYQTHTFSNSIETLVVAWSLVVIQRIKKSYTSAFAASAILGFLAVFGTFNRITYPAFVLVPLVGTLEHFRKFPFTIITFVLSAALTALAAIFLDSSFYTEAKSTFSILNFGLVITPLNNLLYNSSVSNLSKHGLHAFYTHFLVNLPQLLGPALVIMLIPKYTRLTTPLKSALSGTALLSVLPHQEARFLLPAVPLVLVSTVSPSTRHLKGKIWVAAWLVFNLAAAILFGVYHQGGVVPTQFYLSKQPGEITALWWKTYSPPTWLLGNSLPNITTKDLMSLPKEELVTLLSSSAFSCKNTSSTVPSKQTLLVAPLSATFLDKFLTPSSHAFYLDKQWDYARHLNLDDLDFGDDGVLPTLQRVVGRRGIGVWKVCANEKAKTKEEAGTKWKVPGL